MLSPKVCLSEDAKSVKNLATQSLMDTYRPIPILAQNRGSSTEMTAKLVITMSDVGQFCHLIQGR